MTLDELIERLENYRDEVGGDAEVRLMTQQNWPFENSVHGLASGAEINAEGDDEDDDGDVSTDQVLYIVEGQQLCCRAGTETRYWSGNNKRDLLRAGYFFENSGGLTFNVPSNKGAGENRAISGGRTHSVGELNENPFGLYDVHGNVWEWVDDFWSQSYYSQFASVPAVDPRGPNEGTQRFARGGGWFSTAAGCRSSARVPNASNEGIIDIGFRVVVSVDAVRQASQGEK